MARRETGGMAGGPMNTIIGGFIGLLVVVSIIILGPVLAGSIEGAVPDFPDYDDMNVTGAGNITVYPSDWNPEYNADIPDGADLWTQNVTIGGIVILVFFIALAIYYIRIIA